MSRSFRLGAVSGVVTGGQCASTVKASVGGGVETASPSVGIAVETAGFGDFRHQTAPPILNAW
jgi:hypothetical protein